MSKCVFIVEILKSRCNFLRLWGSTCSKKRLTGRSFFQNSGSQGPGRVSPSGSSRTVSALEPFFHVFLSLNGVFIVQLNYHIKASVKLIEFVKENQIIPWQLQGVYFFTNTVLQKSQKHTVVMKNRINTIGKKMHTLVKKNTPRCHKIRQECGFTQKVAFYDIYIIVFSTPLLHIGRKVRLMLPNTYQEIYDTHTCLNFSKTCQNVHLQ